MVLRGIEKRQWQYIKISWSVSLGPYEFYKTQEPSLHAIISLKVSHKYYIKP
jgi:hypothetical protein